MRRFVFLFTCLVFVTPHSVLGTLHSAAAQPPTAQPPAKHVTLRYYGNSFFQLETSTGKKVVFDPHAIRAFYQPNPVEADVVLISHFHNDHTQVGVLANRPQEVLVGLDMPKPGRTEWKEIDKKIGDIR